MSKAHNLISGCVLSILTISFTITTQGQDCPCDKFLDVIYNKTRIQRNQNFQQQFKEYFFSEEFYKNQQNSSTSFDVTVPIDGVPVDFGFGHESEGAWETWKKNIRSTKWDFSKITAETIYLDYATPADRQVWLDCVRSQCNTRLPISYKTTPSGVTITVGYNATLIDKTPVYDEFVGEGIDCSEANRKYKHKPMKKGVGQTIAFRWNDETTETGSISVNTSAGSTITIPFTRTVMANKATATYTIINYGDSSKLEESVLENKFSSRMRGNGMNSVDCRAGCIACSETSGHNYCAQVTPLFIGRAEHTYYRNLKYDCVETGDGLQCGWTAKLLNRAAPYNEVKEGPYLQFWVKTWGNASGWNYSFEVYVSKKTAVRKIVKAGIIDKEFSFVVPKAGTSLVMNVYLKNNHVISFDPQVSPLPDRIQLKDKTEDIINTTYTYSIN